jgi:hypothetical protein
MGLGKVAFRLAVISAATIWLAGCMTAAVGPENPGTRVRGKVPDPQKWVGGQSFGDKRWVYRCRPLACPELSIVTIRTAQSPTRSPDPQALQKFAQESAQHEMTKAEEASAEGGNRVRDISLLSTRVANVKNFPAVHWEYQGISTDNKTVYMVRKMVFAGNTVVDITSSSLGLEVARRNSNDFIGVIVMEIEDFAPPAVAAAKP